MSPGDIYKFDELKTTMSNRSTQARYCISKIANAHSRPAMSRNFEAVKFICVHPGTVATNLHHESSGTFLRAFLIHGDLGVCYASGKGEPQPDLGICEPRCDEWGVLCSC
jgi:hypothetical protein